MKKSTRSTIRDWLIVLASLLDDAAVLTIVILTLRYFNAEITLPIIVVIVLLIVAFFFFIHKAIIPSLHQRKIAGPEGMVGMIGKVVEPLSPSGIVKVGSEYWKAKTIDENIAAGEDVEVLAVKGLALEVRRKVR